MNEHPLEGVAWSDNSLFFTHEWWDETSMYDTDPSVRWRGGTECYERKFRARVPLAFKGCNELIDMFIAWMDDNFPECEEFWDAAKSEKP